MDGHVVGAVWEPQDNLGRPPPDPDHLWHGYQEVYQESCAS